jgi:hypothetical protein
MNNISDYHNNWGRFYESCFTESDNKIRIDVPDQLAVLKNILSRIRMLENQVHIISSPGDI